MRCDECKFFVDSEQANLHPDDRRGNCHRHAPAPSPLWAQEIINHLTKISWFFPDNEEAHERDFKDWEFAVANSFVIWPVVLCDEWCGEWKSRG